MIKRFLVALISALCFVVPAAANVKISPDVVDKVIKQYFSSEKDRASALATYKANLASDGTFAGSDVWKICTAGGLNIKKPADKTKCQNFKNALLKSVNVFLYEVCGKDAAKGICITDFKNVQVTLTPAIKLAKEYVRVKKGDDSLYCSSKYRTEGWPGQDYIKCTSQDKNDYYEFEFDDVTESADNTVKSGIQAGVCGLYGAKSTSAGCVGGGTNVGAVSSCYGASCSADEATCKKINVSLGKFGYAASHKNGTCEINFNSVSKAEDLKTAFGIDNFVFCRGIQVQNAPSAESAVKRYVVSAAAKQGKNITEADVTCLSGFNTYTGRGCNVNGVTDFKDDIKTCKVGSNQIDFVFDDVNESWDTYHAGGLQAMDCITSDGVFDGANCVALGEQQCKELKAASLKNCPECKEIYWDADKALCVLPASRSATNLQKRINYGTLAVTVVAGAAITIGSGGTAGAGVWVVVAKVGTGLVVAGATTKLLAEGVMTWGKFQPFVEKAQKCILSGDGVCAEELVTKDLQEYMSYKKNFTQAEAKALDEIFAKLVEKIPEDSKFWDDFAKDPNLWDCTTDGQTCRIKEEKQLWQYLSTAGDVMMIAGGLMRAIGVIGSQSMPQTTNTLTKKIMVKGGFNRNGQGVRVVSVEGAPKGGTMISNQELVSMGLADSAAPGANVTAANRLLAQGAQLNKPFVYSWQTGAGSVITNTMVPTINAAALGGTALTQAHQLMPNNNYNSFYITRPGATGGKTGGGGSEEGGGASDVGGGDELDEGGPLESDDDAASESENPGSTDTETSVAVPKNNRPTTFYPEKSKNVGLIAGLVAAGLVATGAVVGGVIAANSNSDSSESEAESVSVLDAEMEKVLRNAGGVLGYVGEKSVTLVSLPTTVDTKAKLVDVDGKAVAVVEYNDYKLPFYIKDTKWTPLLGIGKKGRWFNVYPKSSAEIKTLTMITNLMNKKIDPTIVVKYVGPNASGVSLPVAADKAFDIINAEFPNGVVQSEDMSAADAKLYSDNYNLIQRKLE